MNYCESKWNYALEGQISKPEMKRLLAHLLKLKVFTTSVYDVAVDQYSRLTEDEFQVFGKSKNGLDDFFFKVVNMKLFTNLAKVVKLDVTLSHGQASLERGFSKNKFILETNMKEESISARKLIRDHMLAHSLIPKSFLILKHVITSCLSAHRNYQEHSESMKNAKDQEKVLNEKKVLMKEINNTEAN